MTTDDDRVDQPRRARLKAAGARISATPKAVRHEPAVPQAGGQHDGRVRRLARGHAAW